MARTSRPPGSPADVRYVPPAVDPKVDSQEDSEAVILAPDFQPVPPYQGTTDETLGPDYAEVSPYQGGESVPPSGPSFGEIATYNGNANPVPSVDYSQISGYTRGERQKVVTLYNPNGVPCRGQVSFPGPAALRPGEWELLQNVRLDDRGLRVRFGITALIAHTSGDTIYGAFVGYINNVLEVVRAVYRTSGALNKVVIERMTGGGTTWTEISAASGAYGETRFSNSNYAVTFAVAKEVDTSGTAPLANNRELLIIQNGISEPRVWDSVGSTMAKIVEIPALNPPSCRSEATWKYYWNVNDTITFTGSDADYTNTWAATTGAQIIIGTSISNGDDCNVIFNNDLATGSLDDAPARQLHIVFKCTDPSIWQKLTVRLGRTTGPTYYDIHDASATSSTQQNVVIQPLGSDYFVAAFSLANASDGGSPATPFLSLSISDLRRLQFEWQGGTLTTAITLNIVAVGFGGAIQGGAQFGLTLFNDAAHNEGPGVVCRSIGGSRLDHVGGATSTGKGLSLPVHSSLYYDYKLDYELPSTSGPTSHGAKYLMVYMKPVGSAEFLYHSSEAVYSYSGSWSETAAITTKRVRTLTVQTETTTLRPMPDGLHRPIPIGTCMATVSGRLVVGGVVRKSGDSQKGDVWISADQHPFRFRAFVKAFGDNIPDLRSATRVTFPSENVQAFARMSSNILGADNLIIFTDSAVYSLDGSDTVQLSRARRIGPYGTLAPRSVAEHNNQVFWLDQNRNIRVLDSRMTSLSQGRVEDVLTRFITGTNQGGVHGCVHDERYFLWFSIGSYTGYGIGQTNELGLVYDIERDAWTQDYHPTYTRAFGFSTVVSGLPYLYAFHSDGRLFRAEDPNATTNTLENIDLSMKSGVLNADLWHPMKVGRIGIVMGAVNQTLVTTRVSFEKASTTVAGSIDVNVSDDVAWKWDQDSSTKTPLAMAGLGIRVWITKSSTSNMGGIRIYSIVAEVDECDGEGPGV